MMVPLALRVLRESNESKEPQALKGQQETTVLTDRTDRMGLPEPPAHKVLLDKMEMMEQMVLKGHKESKESKE